MPGSIECQRGDTVRGVTLRTSRAGAGRVTGAVLVESLSWALVWMAARGFGQTAGSSPLVPALEKAVFDSDRRIRNINDFI